MRSSLKPMCEFTSQILRWSKWQVQVISPVCYVKNNHIKKTQIRGNCSSISSKNASKCARIVNSTGKEKIWIGLGFFLKIFDDRNKLMVNVTSTVTSKINNLLRAYFFTTFSVVHCINNTENIWRVNFYINQIVHNASANLWSMCLVRVIVMDLIRAWYHVNENQQTWWQPKILC